MQGELSTNDKISLYFKNIPEDKLNITIHDLLRHQSGLKSNVGGDYDRITEDAFIDSVMHSKLQFQPGTAFSYSNIGYSLLGIIIERISGKSYEEYLSENLFAPAGMKSTGYSLTEINKDQIASGYKDGEPWGKPTDKQWDNSSPFWHLKGNGGLLSTTENLFKWHKALLTDNILLGKAKEKYYNPEIRENETRDSYYAYGWDIHKTDRNTSLTRHNGFNGIFYADFLRFIDEGVVIISLSNQAHRSFMSINSEIAKIIFNPSYIPEIPIADNASNRTFTNKIISVISGEGLKAAKEIYQNRDKELNILENDINNKGYELLSKNQIKEAKEFFEMNIFAFPKSANAYDSLAEAYMEQGDKESAIKYYEKSLSLNPDNINAKEMINKLSK
jgi:CubicO group peptidase (beta-lactamase class C family)